MPVVQVGLIKCWVVLKSVGVSVGVKCWGVGVFGVDLN